MDEIQEVLNRTADLASLTDDDLNALLADLLALEQRLFDGDAELTDGLTQQQVIDAMTQVVDAIEQVRAEQSTREEAAAETQAQLDALHQRATAEETPDQGEQAQEGQDGGETPETPAEGGEGGETPAPSEPAQPEQPAEGEQETQQETPEQIAASARLQRPYRPLAPARRDHETITVSEPGWGDRLTAAAGIPGTNPGSGVRDVRHLADLLMRVRNSFGVIPDGMSGDKVIVATAQVDYPDDRVLDDDPIATWQKIEAVIGGPIGSHRQAQALKASGGLCAPSEIFYGLNVLGVTDTPVVASLPSFQARRGGIRYTYAPTLGDVTTAISHITAAQDAAGGTPGQKTCQTVTCPSFVEVLVDAHARCLQFGNFLARTYPELVAAWTDLVGIAFAQSVEVRVIDAIKAGSTAVTVRGVGDGNPASPNVGFFAHVQEVLLKMNAAWRSRWRLAEGITLRAVMPEWVPDAMAADLVLQPYYDAGADDLAPTRANMIAVLRACGVDPVFYKDSPSSGTSQVFGAQGAGNVTDWPDSIQFALYPEGTWLYLDNGSLDLGLVRDSALNKTNDYQVFAEEFFNVARMGPQSLWATMDFSVSGVKTGLSAVTGASVAVG
jgi:hypothetical protein